MIDYIKRMLTQFKNKLFNNKLRSKGIVIHKGTKYNNVEFEGNNTLFENVRLFNSTIGFGTYIGKKSEIHYAQFGKYCSIADNVQIGLGTHPTSKFVTTHPAFYYDTKNVLGFTYTETELFNPYKWINNEKVLVKIGNDVWIGCNAIIMDGVIIGDGAIIAAGAIVTKNVEPYSIVGGIPAKHIKYRFQKEQIEALLSIKWWNYTDSWIKSNAPFFNNIEQFISKFDNYDPIQNHSKN